jgi:hypothetical protein
MSFSSDIKKFAEKAKVNRSSTTTDTATTTNTTTNTTDADGGAQSGAHGDDGDDTGPSPGAQALRRVSSAAHRNRCRILCLAADALGFHIDTLVDNACCESVSKRLAVATLSVTTNSITRNSTGNGAYRYFSGAVDTALSTGVVSCSNAMEGFLMFVDENGSAKVNVKNAAFSGIPFSSQRIKSNKQAVLEAAEKLKKAMKSSSTSVQSAHPDSDWISKRFGWKGRDFGILLEPPPLLGTFSNETFSSVWARELGLSNCRTVRLQPEVVCISATEPSKLRAAARHVLGKK